jgi:hypothetical protein
MPASSAFLHHWQTSIGDVLSFLSEITRWSYDNGRTVQGICRPMTRPIKITSYRSATIRASSACPEALSTFLPGH